MNKLIEQLREGVADTGHLIKSAASVNATMYEAADALEQQSKQIAELTRELNNERARAIHSCSPDCTRAGCVNRRLRMYIEELAIALALKDEALRLVRLKCDPKYGWPIIDKALALQPHDLVRKIKADAVREAVNEIQSRLLLGWEAWMQFAQYADSVERGISDELP